LLVDNIFFDNDKKWGKIIYLTKNKKQGKIIRKRREK